MPMFRLLPRARRSIKIPARNGEVNVQRVRITNTLRRPAVLTLALPFIGFCMIRVYNHWYPDDTPKAVKKLESDFENATKELSTRKNSDQFREHWRKEHDKTTSESTSFLERARGLVKAEANDKFFIGIPFYTRRKRNRQYQESDPEWKEFMKLQEDPARIDELYRAVVTHTLKAFISTGRGARNALNYVGYQDTVGHDLRVVVPLEPPPSYEKPGLVIKPSIVTLEWRTLPDGFGAKYHRVFHPTVFAQAFWAGGKEFFRGSVEAIKGARFGGIFGNTRAPTSTIIDLSQLPKDTIKQKPQAIQAIPSPTQEKSSSGKDATNASKDGESALQLHREVAASVLPEGPLKRAVAVFLMWYTTLQVQALLEPPRGSVLISGHIEFCGPGGSVRTSVSAIYLPATDRFLGPPMIDAKDTYIIPHLPYRSQSAKAQTKHAPTGRTGGLRELAESIDEQGEDGNPESDKPSSGNTSSGKPAGGKTE